MPPPGGLPDKIGNRYEGRIAIGRLLQLLDDQHDSVLFRLEQPGDDSFEWWVQSASGSRTYTQVKRQQSIDEEWTIKTLISRGVIPAFGRRLAEEPDARCEFFSALSASHLQQLSDDARTAGSLAGIRRDVRRGQEQESIMGCAAWRLERRHPRTGVAAAPAGQRREHR